MTLVARMVLAAGLVGAVSCASLAQDTKPADPAKVEADRKAAADAAKMAMEAAEKAKQEAAAAAQKQAAAAQPAAPKGLEVPSLPIVKKTELEGGLIIEDMKIGEGYEVKEGGAVVAHYHGTLKDGGKTFDSSFERGEPIAFPLAGVIAGWQKGVPGMKVGGIRKLTIPAAMGYGERGAGADIPPNADLVFVIELVDALQVEDVAIGTGEEAGLQVVAVTTHTISDTSGKVLEKVEAASPYIWLPGEYQPMQFGLDGMKVGGKRKLTVPKQMNPATPEQPGMKSHPNDQAVVIEFELVQVRNLGARRRS